MNIYNSQIGSMEQTKWKNKKYIKHKANPRRPPASVLDQYLPKSIVASSSTSSQDEDDPDIYIDLIDHEYPSTFEPLENMESTSAKDDGSGSGARSVYPTHDVFDESILDPKPKFKPFYTYDDYSEDLSLNSTEIKMKPENVLQKEIDQRRDTELKAALDEIAPSKKIADNMRKMTTNFNSTTFREFMKSLINYIPEVIDYYIYYSCYKFANLFHKMSPSKKSPDLNSDADTLKTLTYSLLALPLAYYLTYNWWFLFHTDGTYTDYAEILKLASPLNFFFECTIEPMNLVNWALLGAKDGFAKSMFDGIGESAKKFKGLFFLGLLAIIYSIVRYQSAYFNQTLNDVIDSKKNALYSLCFAIVIIAFFFKDAFNFERLTSMATVLGSSFFMLIALLIKFLFVMITVPFSLPFVFLFFIVYSFFGIAMKKGFSEIWNIMGIIDFEIEESFPNPETNNCFEESIFSGIMHYLNKYLFRFLMPIMTIVICLAGIGDIAGMKSSKLQLLVMSFYAIVLGGVGVNMYSKTQMKT